MPAVKRPRFRPDAACVAAAKTASNGHLTDEELDAAFQAVNDFKEGLDASGNIAGMPDQLRSFAARQAERIRFNAAVRKRHAALNILVRDRQEAAIDALMGEGLSPREALLAIMEGTDRGVKGARKSVYALNLAYEARYSGGLMADLQEAVPHAVHMLGDAQLDADIVREMAQLKSKGARGVTGNADALKIARVFAAHAERARVDLNSLGATIGKLDGWHGVQMHDTTKMLAAGKDAWISAVLPRLDLARTFPDGGNFRDILGQLYDEFVTGFASDEIEAAIGSRVHPANLAKQLGVHRVLHFRSPDDALAYRSQYGYGNTFSGMIAYLRNSARSAALMESLGPNPRAMFETLIRNLRGKVASDTSIPDAQRAKWSSQLQVDGGFWQTKLGQALDVATGANSRPANVTMARIGEDIRGVQRMAKLGSAVLSQVSDPVTAALASMFRGTGYFRALNHQVGAIFRGRPKGEVAHLSYILGEGFDGLVGHIVSPLAAEDGPSGFLARLQERFFRWNGQAWATDLQRAAAGRMIAADMGARAGTGYHALPPALRHVLGMHGIDQPRWDALRKAVLTVESNPYITPDAVRLLSDDDVIPFTTFDMGDNADIRAIKIADARRGLELDLLRFVADETNYGILETDARSRRVITQGTRPGTAVGEAIRYITQFKAFPLVFTQRVIGRALYGHRKDAGVIERGTHIGALIAGMTMAGYLAMTMKDIAKGQWPPRDPGEIDTWTAAMLQGGAAGLYGDFLFSQQSRYGSSALETIAGPTIGAASEAFEIGQSAVFAQLGRLTGEEARMPAAEALTLALQNTPFSNLFYTRHAVDALFLNSMREAVSPGYLKRQATRRLKDYGQRPIADYLSGAVQ